MVVSSYLSEMGADLHTLTTLNTVEIKLKRRSQVRPPRDRRSRLVEHPVCGRWVTNIKHGVVKIEVLNLTGLRQVSLNLLDQHILGALGEILALGLVEVDEIRPAFDCAIYACALCPVDSELYVVVLKRNERKRVGPVITEEEMEWVEGGWYLRLGIRIGLASGPLHSGIIRMLCIDKLTPNIKLNMVDVGLVDGDGAGGGVYLCKISI
jgi:hypothetical protein